MNGADIVSLCSSVSGVFLKLDYHGDNPISGEFIFTIPEITPYGGINFYDENWNRQSQFHSQCCNKATFNQFEVVIRAEGKTATLRFLKGRYSYPEERKYRPDSECFSIGVTQCSKDGRQIFYLE